MSPGLVDVHTHVVPERFPDLVARYPYDRWPSMRRTGSDTAELLVGGAHFRDVDERCWSVGRRRADMRAEGVDIQVLSPTPVTFCYRAPTEGARELARWQNDVLAEMVAEDPEHFRALGTVPLQDPASAVAELRRCVDELGFLGVEIGTTVGGRELDDPAFHPFFAAAEAAGALLLVHPDEIVGSSRVVPRGLAFGVGIPGETLFGSAALLAAGAFDRWPDLLLCLAHGGGALPMVLPRIDEGWRLGGGPPPNGSAGPPGSYADRLFSDSLTYDPASLALSLHRFGAGHVLLGTDYPFDAREVPAGRVLANAGDLLDADAVEAIGGVNARQLLDRISRVTPLRR
jgi:aminocarboxymuconate-semialdehyde decarboxylase